MVDRSADRFGEAAIIERGGDGLAVAGEFDNGAVELIGSDAGAHQRNEKVEGLRSHPAGLAHGGKALRAMQLDLAGAAFGAFLGFHIGHDGLT